MADDEREIRAQVMAKRPYAGRFWSPWVDVFSEGEPSRTCPRCGETHTVFQCLHTRNPAAKGLTIWALWCFLCRDVTNQFDCRHFLCAARCKNATECDNVRYYDIAGMKYPSVTSILGFLPDPPGLANWKATNPNAERMFREAAVVGTITHFRIENILARRCGLPLHKLELHPSSPPVTPEMTDRVKRNLAVFSELDAQYAFQPVTIEQTVCNPLLGYAGTLDMICVGADGQRVLVDIKTGKWVYDKYRAQLWAYSEALAVGGQSVSSCAVLRLGDNGGEYVVVEPDQDLFFKALAIYLDSKK